jgi:SAM-dependent methyltransferase
MSSPSGTPHLFERELYLSRRKKATGPADLLLTKHITTELVDRLQVISRTFESILLISDRATAIAPAVEALAQSGRIECFDPRGTEDLHLAPDHFDAVISLLDLQTVNDVPGHLAQIAQSLKSDGLFLGALFGEDTLTELRECWLEAESAITGRASLRVAPMIGTRELGSLLQRARLALPVSDSDRHTVRYDNAFDLMLDIKALGLANPMIEKSQGLVSQRLLAAVADIYAKRFVDPDGRIRATINILWGQAWKPHPSQPKPLKPGSAKMLLADALKSSNHQN